MNKLIYVTLASFMLVGCNSVEESKPVEILPVEVTSPVTEELTDEARAALATKVFYFAFDSSDLSAQDRSTLVYHAVNLKGDTDLSIRLEGHASEEGTREYNVALGERRAKSIAMFLMANGVSASQIEVVSYGEEMPAALGSTEASLSKNRRVELK